ncbi:MAG: hypothetical protein U9Q62_08575 [Campylobacterota bacterium]|nr:hypothetical protein [Campylobacterota bacterium]
MKKSIIGLSLSFVSLWAEPAYSDIYASADKAVFSRKPIVFVVMSSTCSHCYSYWNRTLSDPDIETLLDNNFELAVSVVDQGGKIPSNLPFKGQLPTTYILSADAKLLSNPIEGDIDKTKLYSLLYSLNEARRSE